MGHTNKTPAAPPSKSKKSSAGRSGASKLSRRAREEDYGDEIDQRDDNPGGFQKRGKDLGGLGSGIGKSMGDLDRITQQMNALEERIGGSGGDMAAMMDQIKGLSEQTEMISKAAAGMGSAIGKRGGKAQQRNELIEEESDENGTKMIDTSGRRKR